MVNPPNPNNAAVTHAVASPLTWKLLYDRDPLVVITDRKGAQAPQPLNPPRVTVLRALDLALLLVGSPGFWPRVGLARCMLGTQALRQACHTGGRAVDIGVIGADVLVQT